MAGCPDYLLAEKIHILQLRSQQTKKKRKMPWDQVAAEAGRRKKSCIAVDKWLQELPWEEARVFPIAVQMLRKDFLQRKGEDLQKQLAGGVPEKVASGKVVVPAETMVVEHGLGEPPTRVEIELLDGEVLSPVARGNLTAESLELRAQMSGPLVRYRAVVDNSVPPDYDGY